MLAALLFLWAAREIYIICKRSYMVSSTLASAAWKDKKAAMDRHSDTATIIFLGNSLTEWFDLSVFGKKNILNFGIAGDFSAGVLQRLDPVIRLRPSKVFIEIGINDIVQHISVAEIAGNYRSIISQIREGSPATRLFVQSNLPVSFERGWINTPDHVNEQVVLLNRELEKICAETGCTYIDLYSLFEEKGRLPAAYTYDGVHLNAAGYALWKSAVEQYVNE